MASKSFFVKEKLSEVEQQVNAATIEYFSKLKSDDSQHSEKKKVARDSEILAALHYVAVKVINVSEDKDAYVIFVPYRQHKTFQKIQERLVSFLEKKFSGHFLIVAKRDIYSEKQARRMGIQRTYTRTRTGVLKALLDDIVYPSVVAGKRTRVRLDNSKLLKIFIGTKEPEKVEDKLKTFATVYSKFSRAPVEFSFHKD